MTSAGAPLGLRCSNLEKRFGNFMALRRLSFEIRPGEAVALAGHNGSGKTTFLRIAAGLSRPTSGSLHVGSEDIITTAVRMRIGFVAHQTMLYDELTAEENLLLFARLQGISASADRTAELLRETGLAERRCSLVRTFSRGMRQRLTIARALLHAPSLLLFDEPGTGLDAPGISWLAATLLRVRQAGCTILMSLHGQAELAAVATRAMRLEAGSLAADSLSGESIESVLRVKER
ncbi:MAG: ABC transporter ATP-binding protein [Acidobacteriia bacterium]|nr:ABC transporter ATP-binding protein [Terriglobia bacterium]